jgi:hypothetical protein
MSKDWLALTLVKKFAGLTVQIRVRVLPTGLTTPDISNQLALSMRVLNATSNPEGLS